jgi:inner membrane protein
MPSVFSHAIVGAALGTAFVRAGTPRRVLVLGAACASLPDVDVVAWDFGVRFGGMLGHRGLTHSLIVAAILAGALATLAPALGAPLGRVRFALYIGVATASHGLLDAMTNGGPGVALFAPLSGTRYFFPFRPIEVSPIGVAGFFSARALRILRSEALWLWLPAGVWVMLVRFARRRSR